MKVWTTGITSRLSNADVTSPPDHDCGHGLARDPRVVHQKD